MAEVGKTFSISEALRFGWETTRKNFGFLLLAILVALVAASLPSQLAERIRDYFPIYAAFLDLAGIVLAVIVELGLLRVVLKLVDGKKPVLADLFSTLPLFFNFVFASLVYGTLVFIGLLFFIVPGVILAITLWPYEYLIVDKKLGAWEVLKKSAEITSGVKGQLFLYGLAAIGINILGATAFLVGLLVTIPLTMLSSAYVYRKLILRLRSGSTLSPP